MGKCFSVAWGSSPGTKTLDIVFQTPGQCFFVSISKHTRFILQSNADFRMGKKGPLKINVLYLEVHKKCNKKKEIFFKGTRHKGRSWEVFVTYFLFTHGKTTDILGFIFCSWIPEREKEGGFGTCSVQEIFRVIMDLHSYLNCFIYFVLLVIFINIEANIEKGFTSLLFSFIWNFHILGLMLLQASYRYFILKVGYFSWWLL